MDGRRLLRDTALPGGALLAAAIVPPPGPDNRSLLRLPNLCPFRTITGKPCPGCGITRSMVCMAHGQVERGFVLHPAGPFLLALCVGAVAVALIRQRRADAFTAPIWRHAASVYTLALAVGMLVLWPLRLLGIVAPPP